MACAAQHGTCIDERQHRHSSKPGDSLTEHFDVAVIGGGQSGLATAHALPRRGLRPVVLEASGRAAGSWPRYHDSLTLFSPARYSSLPGMPFPGAERDRYPHRDEVVAHLTAQAGRLDAEIRTGCRVTTVRRTGDGFAVELEGGGRLSAQGVVTASGSFGRPHRPALPGPEDRREGAARRRLPQSGPVHRAPSGRGRGRELCGADRRRAR